MRKKRFTEKEIFDILKEAEAGMTMPEACRKYGISKNTFYNWRSKYSGMELTDLQKMRQFEDENNRLKKIVAEQMLDIQALKAMLSKKY